MRRATTMKHTVLCLEMDQGNVSTQSFVFFFWTFVSTRNSMRSTDPSLVAATCIYLACKIEECPQHIKHIITEMKGALASNVETIPQDGTRIFSHVFFLFAHQTWIPFVDHGGFDYDTSKVAEFEFYLLEELEFYLIVYHPYRDLTLIAKELRLEESNLQTAW